MPIQLIITNIGFAISLVVCIGLGLLVYIRRPKENNLINKVFLLFSISAAVWIASYALGINIYDPELSRLAFMFNMATLYLTVLTAHFVLLITKRIEKQKKIINILYIIATLLIVYYVIFPDQFMLPSSPALYLPNFLVPGPLYYLQDMFFFGVTVYFLFHLGSAYHHADYNTRNRLKYLIVGFLYGYTVALVPEFLLYGIAVDPLPAAFMGLYTIPFSYAILKYEVIDINVLAKKAFGYAVGVAVVTLFILFTGYANTTIHYYFPGLPEWLLPLFSAVVAVIFAIIVWNNFREVNLLKYQFIDVVTHKFRTPLTYIHWSLETLRNNPNETEKAKAMDAISDAYVRLSELTDSLIGLSGADDNQFVNKYEEEELSILIDEIVNVSGNRIKEKNLNLQVVIPSDLPKVYIEKKKIAFALQMVFDNAITYSHRGGKILVSATKKREFAVLSVRDYGIGIKPEDLNRLFVRFYRGSNAISTHTEGLGIGLYLAREILRKQGGNIKVESEGLEKGSVFIFELPLVKK